MHGPTGATGAPGSVGPQGPTGPQGPSGLQGATGINGPAGPQGPQGERGDNGVPGSRGPSGEPGIPGTPGATGPTGPQGPTGMPPPVIMWSGGCSTISTVGTGWSTYCLDAKDFSTADDYLQSDPSGIVTFKKNGFYRINLFALHGSTAQSYLQVSRNNQILQYEWRDEAYNWTQLRVDVTWPFLAGDQLSVIIYECNGGHYPFDIWRPLTEGAYSRMQVQLIGGLPDGFLPP